MVLTSELAVPRRKPNRINGRTSRSKTGFQTGDLGPLNPEATCPAAVPLDVLDDDVPMTIEEVCAYLGGSKPINPATIYKWIADPKKLFPKPYKPGTQTSRWLKSEVVAYRRKKIIGEGQSPKITNAERKNRFNERKSMAYD